MPPGPGAKFVNNLPRFPKPPKSTLRVGTDITLLMRHQAILSKAAHLSRVGPGLGHFDPDTLTSLSKLFAKRFHRWELPFLVYRLRRYANRWDKFIPVLPTASEKAGKRHQFELAALTRWCAGRWAMKEAVIKALWPRPVFHSDIAVLPEKAVELLATAPEYALRSQSMIPQMKLSEEALGGKPIVLVRPPVPTITMSVDVAIRRGIALNRQERERKQVSRRALSHISTWQMLDGSISHDGHLAIASVVAEPQQYEAQPTLVDDGSADFLQHEPKLADRGYVVYRIVPSRFAPDQDKERNSQFDNGQLDGEELDEAAFERDFDDTVGKQDTKPFASHKKFGRHPPHISLGGFDAAPHHRVVDESKPVEEVEQPAPVGEIDEQHFLDIKQQLSEDEFLGPIYAKLVRRAEEDLTKQGLPEEELFEDTLLRQDEEKISKGEQRTLGEQQTLTKEESPKEDYQAFLRAEQRLSEREADLSEEEPFGEDELGFLGAERHLSGEEILLEQDEQHFREADRPLSAEELGQERAVKLSAKLPRESRKG